MNPNPKYGRLADDSAIARAVESLKRNGISAEVVRDGKEAKERLLKLIPEGAEVMNMTSATLDSIGASKEIAEGPLFDPVRRKLGAPGDKAEKRRLGAAPEWAVGSVHAVTEDGKVIVASATGSQLPAYAYGAGNVVWVVGAQKIVRNLEEGLKRVEEYVFPLEDERARKVYGVGSGINKLLILNREVNPGRIRMIIVKEKLGF